MFLHLYEMRNEILKIVITPMVIYLRTIFNVTNYIQLWYLVIHVMFVTPKITQNVPEWKFWEPQYHLYKPRNSNIFETFVSLIKGFKYFVLFADYALKYN